MHTNSPHRWTPRTTISAVSIALGIIVIGACGARPKSAGTPVLHRSGDLAAAPGLAGIGQTVTLRGTNWPAEQISIGVFVEGPNYPGDFLNTYEGHAYTTVATIGATANFSLTYEVPVSLTYGSGVSVAVTPGMKLDFFTKEPRSAHTGPTVSIVAK